MQNLLLGLGTALVAAAAIGFTAVNWSRLGANFQALALVVLTAVATCMTIAASRRRMPATAEALGAVAVLLGLADAHAFRVGAAPAVDPAAYWAVAVAVVGLGSWLVGRLARVTSTGLAAVVLGQLTIPLLISATQMDRTTAGVIVLIQAAVVLLLALRRTEVAPVIRHAAAVLGAGTWTIVASAAVMSVLFTDQRDLVHQALVLAVATGVAALLAAQRPDDARIVPISVLAATLTGIAALVVLLASRIEGQLLWGLVALSLALVAAVAARVDRRWGMVPAVLSAVGAGGLGLTVVHALGVVVNAALSTWSTPGGADLSSRVTELDLVRGQVTAPGPLSIHLVAMAGLVIGLRPLIGRTTTVRSAMVLAVASVVITPLVLPLSVGGAAAVTALCALLLGAASVGSVTRTRRDAKPILTRASWAALVVGAMTVAWTGGDSEALLAVVGVLPVVAAAFTVASRAAGVSVVAVPAACVATLALSAEAGLVASATGESPSVSIAAVGVAALVWGLLGALVFDPQARRSNLDGRLAVVVEATAWVTHGMVLGLGIDQVGSGGLRVTLASGVLAAVLHTIRARRHPLVWLAAGEGLVLMWTELAIRSVAAPEPYSLPLAAVLLAAGFVAERRLADEGDELASWVSFGPGLVVGFVPTVWVSLVQGGSVRPLVGLVAGTLVLIAGAWTARRSLVDIGAVATALLALHQIAPVVSDLPSWATLATSGALLLAVGATFEQRRRDLRDVRHRYSSLR